MATNLQASFMRSLCMGEIEEDVVFPFPKMKPEEAQLCKQVIDSIKPWLSSKEADYRKWDVAGEIPSEFIDEMKNFGLFSFIIPEEFGGMGLHSMAYSRCMQELVKYDGSVAITAGAHSSIGMRGLYMFGTPEQKAKYMPKLATGEMIAAYCLTEAGAGSDAASIKTRAAKDGDDWILNGEKIWITNGGIANFFTVFAQTNTPEGKITAFIVTRDMPGVKTGPHEDKMGIRASSTTSVYFDNVRVPKENVLGEVGKGFKVAVRILNNGRTGLGGGCIGGMKKCIELATKQAKQRVQFGQPIAEFGLVKQKLGHMVVDCYAAESVVNMVSGLIDQGFEDYAVEAAISKVFATEALWRTVDEALQIAGGNGYMREFPYEKFMRDCRINRIFEGTNDILRLFIALTPMNDVGKHLKELSDIGKVLSDPIKGFGLLLDYGRRRMAGATGYGGASLTRAHPLLKSFASDYEAHVRELTNTVDRLLRKHGKGIIGKQFATRRLAEIMIDMFTLVCVISRVSQAIEEKGEAGAKKEIEILEVFNGQCRGRIARNYNKIDNNDDELIKDLADYAVEAEGYSWDNI
jgi:alkylation response protein AidB-like acyl-CoA dehydrogenase